MAIQIQVRRDTAANWTSEDPTLAVGEFGLETDTSQLKIGDGATAWVGLAYVTDSANPFDQDLNTTDAVVFAGLTNNSIIYPTADGTIGQVIETDGAGNLSFVTSAGGGVSSLTAGTGISVDVTTGDITVTNSEPDQTVTLTDGAGITVTGTYPSFTIDCSITQYADADARLALSAGTGITYDNTTGIITNDNPDQTVTLTDGADITITGTYPSFTIAYSGAGGGAGGTVTSASVISANGFAGSVATDTTTPAITISTSITGILIGDGTSIAAATAGTDYLVPTSPAIATPTITGLIEVKTAPTISSGVLDLDCALGNVFHVSLDAAITSITFSNIPAGAYGLTLAFTCDGTARAVTWPAAVKWSGGTAPTLTSTNAKVDIFVLNVWDGTGATWYAMVGGQNF